MHGMSQYSTRVRLYYAYNKKEVALNALKWLRQNSNPWNERLCACAARNRNP